MSITVGWALPTNVILGFSSYLRECPPYKKQLLENGARSQYNISQKYGSRMETTNLLDLVAGGLAVVILISGLFMLFSGMSAFGDKDK
ncbi:MAG TPA: hypothetical protein DEG17_05915 [Cyanobacteria bacterium UBA11149]|nr:hypothetical protein [Cyanobacteria bacterium UBA11166]HBR76918.1 hypothetical protein [Cyanobacteria bacterium UBA11159]HBW88413.1 hypothetical protein [Cyanobacteria bacterium UBA11149]HCA95503.1 hypothetical protein [Cyanobacteria bacterium UBA9226]